MHVIVLGSGVPEEQIRKAAKLNQLPADKITPVRVLDPYFYMSGVAQ